MSSKKFLWKIIAASFTLYIIIAGLIFYSIYAFKNTYETTEVAYTKEIKDKIDKALQAEDMTAALDELIEDYAVEIIIYDEDEELVYTSLHLKEGQQLAGILNANAKLQEAGGSVEIDGENYYIWYNIYRIPFMNQLESFLLKYNIFILIIFFVLLGMIVILQIYLFKPLYNVKDALDKWQENRFDEVKESKDAVNQELQSYFTKQRDVIKAVSSKNTKLELSLGLERERLRNTVNLSRALVHDLKSPVHKIRVEDELRLGELDITCDESKIISWHIDQADLVLNDINSVLQVLKEEGYRPNSIKESFDLQVIIMNAVEHFKPEMRKKDLYFFYEGEDSEMLVQNKVGAQLVIHNIFSNMVHYSTPGTEINITVNRRGSDLWVMSSNQSSQQNIERMKKSEQLDSLVNESREISQEEYRYSSGNGMYLIKDLSDLLGGGYSYYVEDNVIHSILIIPDKKEELWEKGK